MTDETIVAIYQAINLAEAAISDLKSAGFPASAISLDTETAPSDAVVSVRATDAQVARIMEILEQYDPIDIDELADGGSQDAAATQRVVNRGSPGARRDVEEG